jgi:hypothetical protein
MSGGNLKLNEKLVKTLIKCMKALKMKEIIAFKEMKTGGMFDWSYFDHSKEIMFDT